MGRILVDGEPGNDLVPELGGPAGRGGDREAGQGRVLCHRTSTTSCKRDGIGHLVFAGVTTEVCVQTTMREANDRGYECPCWPRTRPRATSPSSRRATLAMIRAQGGIVGWTAPTDDTHRSKRSFLHK